MSRTTRWSSLALALGLSLTLVGGAVTAQSDEPTNEAVPIPELEGLAWYRSDELSGPEMESTLPAEEVADWAILVDGAGASLEDLEYTYQSAYDPAALPNLGGIATVRVVGANTETLRAVVAEDIVNQVVKAGFEAPSIEPATISGKDVVIVAMPDEIGLEDAVIYASDDVAWALVLAPELASSALEQLP